MGVRELQQKKDRYRKQMRDILDTVEEDESRDTMTADEESKFEKLNDKVDDLQERIEAERRVDELDDEVEETTGEGRTEPGENDERSKEMRAFEAKLKHRDDRTKEERQLQANLDESGGFTVAPQEFVQDLIKFIDDETFMRELSNVTEVTDTDSVGRPSLDADPEDATWTSEVGSVNEDSQMDFGARELNPNQLAKLLKVSRRLVQVSAMDITELVRNRLAYKFGITEEKGYLNGSGASEPLGVFTASDDGISTSRDISEDMETDAITADGLISAKFALKEGYFDNAEWIFHRDAVKQIRKLTTTDGQYIWQPGLQAGQPDRILNVPYNMSEYAPNTFSSGNYVGIIGDFQQGYWIVDSLMFEVQVLEELYAENNQIGYIGRAWKDGMPVLEEAFARVTLA